MAKSLIKTVDGIGIWVRDDAYKDTSFGIREIISVLTNIFIVSLVVYHTYKLATANNEIITVIFIELYISMTLFIVLLILESWCGFFFRSLPAYKIYPASDMEDGITVFKTTNEQSDQIAICKAAKEIESRCHDVAKNRRELDRIAGNCK